LRGRCIGLRRRAITAKRITEHLESNKDAYDYVIASRDWHKANDANDGHFAAKDESPDFKTSWPEHCVEEEMGSQYHANLDTSLIDIHIKKAKEQTVTRSSKVSMIPASAFLI